MLVVLLFLLILIIVSWFRPKWAFYLLLVLIPFHAFFLTGLAAYLHLTPVQDDLLAGWKEIILTVLVVKIIWHSAKSKKFPFKIIVVDKLIFVLFILALITIPFLTKNFSTAIWGLRYDFEMFLIYFISRSFVWQKIEIKKAVAIVATCGLVVAILAILQATALPKDFLTHFGYSANPNWQAGQPLPAFQQIGGTNITRVQSTLAGPNQLGSYLLILLPLALTFLWYFKNPKAKLTMAIYLAIFSGALFFTYSRSAWLGAAAILVAFFIIILNKKQLSYFVATLAILSIAGWLIFKNLLTDKFINIFLEHQGSTPERISRLGQSLQILFKHPFGIGIGKAGLASLKNSATSVTLTEDWYLQVGVELGLAGLLIYLVIIWQFFKNLWLKFKKPFTRFKNSAKQNSDQVLSLALFLALVGLSVHSLFLHTWSDITTVLTFWLLVGIAVSEQLAINNS